MNWKKAWIETILKKIKVSYTFKIEWIQIKFINDLKLHDIGISTQREKQFLITINL